MTGKGRAIGARATLMAIDVWAWDFFFFFFMEWV